MPTRSSIWHRLWEASISKENYNGHDTAYLGGHYSWALIGYLKLDCSFLDRAVATWSECPAYKSSAATAKSLNVVTDCAERSVKLRTDFQGSARTEFHYQDVLQVVEQDRRSHPNLRKRRSTAL